MTSQGKLWARHVRDTDLAISHRVAGKADRASATMCHRCQLMSNSLPSGSFIATA
jgi:hypothetical protein